MTLVHAVLSCSRLLISLSLSLVGLSCRQVIRGYGALLVDMCATVPDGVICFFVSYTNMENIVSTWADQGIIDKIRRNKLV